MKVDSQIGKHQITGWITQWQITGHGLVNKVASF